MSDQEMLDSKDGLGEKRNGNSSSEKNSPKKDKSGKKRIGIKKKIGIAILVLFLVTLPGYFLGLTVRTYEVRDERILGSLRIALVTDLHSCKYGEGQKELLTKIEEQKPDVILLGGDIFDDKLSDVRTEEFLAGISGKYPCYYVTGNHEAWAGGNAYRTKMEILKKYDITKLSGDSVLLETGSGTVRLCGVDDPDIILVQAANSFETEFAGLRESISEEEFTILLTHRPEMIERYAKAGFDLVLAGHAHGGQVRIPGIMNGFYAPNQGLFPKYAGGRYDLDGMTMIVSRGLARESTFFPRFCNAPELVIIDLSGKGN